MESRGQSYCDARRVYVGRTVTLPGGRVVTIRGIGSDGRASFENGPGSVSLYDLGNCGRVNPLEVNCGRDTDH